MKNILAKAAFTVAKKDANKGCPWWFHCSRLPDKVKKLKK